MKDPDPGDQKRPDSDPDPDPHLQHWLNVCRINWDSLKPTYEWLYNVHTQCVLFSKARVLNS